MLLSLRGLIPTPRSPPHHDKVRIKRWVCLGDAFERRGQMKVEKNMKANAEVAYFQTVKIQVSLANLTLINVGTDISNIIYVYSCMWVIAWLGNKLSTRFWLWWQFFYHTFTCYSFKLSQRRIYFDFYHVKKCSSMCVCIQLQMWPEYSHNWKSTFLERGSNLGFLNSWYAIPIRPLKLGMTLGTGLRMLFNCFSPKG